MRLIKITKGLRGFTLIEILVALIIIPILILIVGQTYNTYFKTFLNQSALIQANTQNKIALEEISNTISESIGVGSCFFGDHTTCQSFGFPSNLRISNATTIILLYWPIDPTTKIPYNPSNSKYDRITYTLAGNQVRKYTLVNDGGNPTTRQTGNKYLFSGITSLTFVYDPPSGDNYTAKKVTITLTTESKNGNKTFTSTNTSEVYLRNKE